jgi:hypothetical protein
MKNGTKKYQCERKRKKRNKRKIEYNWKNIYKRAEIKANKMPED